MIPQNSASTSPKTLRWEPQILPIVTSCMLGPELQGSQPKYCIEINSAPSSGTYNTEINGLVKS